MQIHSVCLSIVTRHIADQEPVSLVNPTGGLWGVQSVLSRNKDESVTYE